MMIRAEALELSYGKKIVLQDVSFQIEKGRFVALVGDNGSGKSTLLSAMAGAMKPQKGSLTVSGKIGYIPQGSGLMEELTFGDNLRFFAAVAHVRVPAALPFGAEKLLNIRVRDMSGGMKKLCSIVCAVVGQPQVLLLDEPCASLDTEHKRMLLDYLQEAKDSGITVVYVGHDPTEYRDLADGYLHVGSQVRLLNKTEEASV